MLTNVKNPLFRNVEENESDPESTRGSASRPKFKVNRLSRFSVILLTDKHANKHANKQTKSSHSITCRAHYHRGAGN